MIKTACLKLVALAQAPHRIPICSHAKGIHGGSYDNHGTHISASHYQETLIELRPNCNRALMCRAVFAAVALWIPAELYHKLGSLLTWS